MRSLGCGIVFTILLTACGAAKRLQFSAPSQLPPAQPTTTVTPTITAQPGTVSCAATAQTGPATILLDQLGRAMAASTPFNFLLVVSAPTNVTIQSIQGQLTTLNPTGVYNVTNTNGNGTIFDIQGELFEPGTFSVTFQVRTVEVTPRIATCASDAIANPIEIPRIDVHRKSIVVGTAGQPGYFVDFLYTTDQNEASNYTYNGRAFTLYLQNSPVCNVPVWRCTNGMHHLLNTAANCGPFQTEFVIGYACGLPVPGVATGDLRVSRANVTGQYLHSFVDSEWAALNPAAWSPIVHQTYVVP